MSEKNITRNSMKITLVSGVLILLSLAALWRYLGSNVSDQEAPLYSKEGEVTVAGTLPAHDQSTQRTEAASVKMWNPNMIKSVAIEDQSDDEETQRSASSPALSVSRGGELSQQTFDPTMLAGIDNIKVADLEVGPPREEATKEEQAADHDREQEAELAIVSQNEQHLEFLFHKLEPAPSIEPNFGGAGEIVNSEEVSNAGAEKTAAQQRRNRVGVRSLSRTDFLNVSPQKEVLNESESDSDNQQSLLVIPNGHARGYSMLYAMRPEARAVVESEMEILLASRIKQIHLGILTDGTFGWDPDYVQMLIRRAAEEGRSLSLTLYVSNGSTQRILEESEIRESFPQLSPESFREAIQFDPLVRAQYIELVRRLIPIFILNRDLNSSSKNFIVPMLEDNLTASAFQAIKELTEREVGSLATIVRNPCIGCYPGNDFSRLGVPLELHGMENVNLLRPGDAFSLDGTGYRSADDAQALPSAVSTGAVEELLGLAQRLPLRYFGLWRADRQGIVPSEGDRAPKHPRERDYVPPSDTLREVEKAFFRYGLEE